MKNKGKINVRGNFMKKINNLISVDLFIFARIYGIIYNVKISSEEFQWTMITTL